MHSKSTQSAAHSCVFTPSSAAGRLSTDPAAPLHENPPDPTNLLTTGPTKPAGLHARRGNTSSTKHFSSVTAGWKSRGCSARMLRENENPETAVCWWLIPRMEEGKGDPLRLHLTATPIPAPTRSRWVRMRTDDAPQEENGTNHRDGAVCSPAPPARSASRPASPAIARALS